MPRDASDYIVSAILCLLAILGYLGFTSEQKERLERVMSYHEEVWERSREGNRLMGCFRSGYQELYLIDDTLMTGKAEASFKDCVK